MINRNNILGWINLAFRLVLSFGLIFVVNRCIGKEAVGLWMVYITIIATINSIDGLLSQFFIRGIISAAWSEEAAPQSCQYRKQQVLYWALGAGTFFVGYGTLKMHAPHLFYVSALLAVYLPVRVYDSRFRAYVDVALVQKTEIMLNAVLMLVVALALLLTKDIGTFILVHLSGLICLFAVKYRMVARSDGHRRYLARSGSFTRRFDLDPEILKTIVICFGSGLSINLSLIAMEALIPSGVSTGFLFTYRVGSLICEVISIPVIVRIPEITRAIAAGRGAEARKSFAGNYWVSLSLCALAMVCVLALQGVWNAHMPARLCLVQRVVLLNILGGWLFERSATLLSQYFLSSKSYSVYRYYILYALCVAGGVVASVACRREELFAYVVLLTNAIMALLVSKKWRSSNVRKAQPHLSVCSEVHG